MNNNESGCSPPIIAIITVCYKSNYSLPALAQSLNNQTNKSFIWILIDNAPSSNPVIVPQTNFPIYILQGQEGNGFGSGCNLGLEFLKKRSWINWVWLLNPDTSLIQDIHIERLNFFLSSIESNSILGTTVIDSNKFVEDSAGWISRGLMYRRFRINQYIYEQADSNTLTVDWVSGCNLLFKPSNFAGQLKFDAYFPLYFEDIDFCLRAKKAGAACIWIKNLTIFHQKGAGSVCSQFRRERLKSISQVRFLLRYQSPWIVILHISRIIVLSALCLPTDFRKSTGKLSGVLLALSIEPFIQLKVKISSKVS